jgi:hypothetical protein
LRAQFAANAGKFNDANCTNFHQLTACRKAAVNAPQSRRFAKFEDVRQVRQRLDCGDFSTAFGRGEELNAKNIPVLLRLCVFALELRDEPKAAVNALQSKMPSVCR